MVKLQGEHIDFSLNFTAGSNPDYASWADFVDVFVFLFTDSCYAIPFSMNAKEGYNTMTLSEADMIMSGVALPDQTKDLKPGMLQYELKCIGVADTTIYEAKDQVAIDVQAFVNKAVE